DCRHQLIERAVERQAVDVHHQAVGAVEHEMLGFELGVHFQGDAGVFVCRPGPHGHNAGGMGHPRNNGNEEQRGGARDQAPSCEVGGWGAGVAGKRVVSHSDPFSLYGVSTALRPSSSCLICISRSGGGKCSPACSGHSIKTTASSSRMSRNPASSHSRESLNL